MTSHDTEIRDRPSPSRSERHLRDWGEVDRPRRAPLRGRVARLLLERMVRGLDLRVTLPDGTVLGRGGPEAPALVIRTERFFDRVGTDHTIGVGEGYLAGEWGPAPGTDLAEALTPLAEVLPGLVPGWLKRFRRVVEARHPTTEAGDTAGARSNVSRHYDLSNALFATFLDETMSYSGAWFADPALTPAETPSQDPADALARAQRRKVDGILDLAGVATGTTLLEIGTGWGQLAIQAADRGAEVTSVTLSREQLELAARRVAQAGHAERVDLSLRDYREVPGTYDAVASVEMIEAVGHDYWDDYFAAVARTLRPGGRFALQAITMSHEAMLSSRHAYTWIHKYVFPGGLIPSVEAIEASAGRAGLVIEERRSLGPDYARTLWHWRQRFAERAEEVEALGFDARFRDVWEFYLAYSEAGFRSGYLDVWQFGLRAGGAGR